MKKIAILLSLLMLISPIAMTACSESAVNNGTPHHRLLLMIPMQPHPKPKKPRNRPSPISSRKNMPEPTSEDTNTAYLLPATANTSIIM